MKSSSLLRAVPPRVTRVVVCGIFLLICMTTVMHRSTSRVDFTKFSYVLHLRPPEETIKANKQKLSDTISQRLLVLEPAEFGNESDFKCVKAKLGNLSFPMCIYNTKDDRNKSTLVKAGRYLEAVLIQKILTLFSKHPDMSFVDIGANLGTYSLPMAHSGHHVVSVEPNPDTVRRLAKSVHLGRIEHYIDVFHYALSNEDSTTFLKFNVWNRGDTFMAENESCPGCMSTKVTTLNKLLPFIRHKKAFIKIDAQEAEIKIFQNKSAAKFFSLFDVVMVQMEWDFYRKSYGKTEVERRRVDRFLEFFYQRGYDVYDPRTEKRLGANWTTWTYDILFKKEDLPNDKLFLL